MNAETVMIFTEKGYCSRGIDRLDLPRAGVKRRNRSNGAQIFNETMPKIVVELLDSVAGLTLVHQAGGRQPDCRKRLWRVGREHSGFCRDHYAATVSRASASILMVW